MWFGKNSNKTGSDAEARAGRTGAHGASRAKRLSPLQKGVILAVLGLIALGAVAWIVWRTGALLFWENPRYAIRKLAIRVDGQTITPQHVREYTRLGEGTNLFAFDLEQTREDFLKKVPPVRSIAIRRRLPDTVMIEVTERVPVARIGRWESVGVDREGWMFNLRAGGQELPVISGAAQMSPRLGTRVGQAALNAIEVFEACKRSRAGDRIRIASIDVTPKDYLDVYLSEGQRIKLAWEGMGTASPAARQQLDKKLGQLADALKISEERGRKLSTLDLTFDDPYVPGQEY